MIKDRLIVEGKFYLTDIIERMDQEQKYKDGMAKFQRVINRFGEIDKKPRDFGTGDKLFPSEIHTIAAIGEHPSINVTDLSIEMGVTKSAISQIVKKLEAKKYVRRYKEKDNNKEVLLDLLEKGKMAFWGHRSYHLTMDKPIIDLMGSATKGQMQFFLYFLDELDKYTQNVIDERS
jgi:DNA-binding MarR family transcriptional regulator